MENLVISIFNTESEAYQSFADLKAFRQTQTTKVAQIALVKNENGHIVEKERYDFEDSTTDATLEGGLLGAVIGLLGGPIGVLFGYGIGSLYGLAAGDTVDTAEAGLIDVVSQKSTAKQPLSPWCKKTTKQSSMLTSPSTTPKSCVGM